MHFDNLKGHTYANITTYRKDGSAATTPVWFVLKDDVVYLWTNADSWKAKRLGRNPRCALVPCNATGSKNLGESAEGIAELLPEARVKEMRSLFRKRYGLQGLAVELGGRIKPGNRTAYFEIRQP